jgi:cytochrome c553
MKTTPTMRILSVLLALGVGTAAEAADLGMGQAKAKEVCAACHGLDGNSATPDYPRLAGQYPDYLAKALRDYKSGQRKNPIMGANAAALSKEDIANLAAWFSSQPAAVTTRY